MINRCNMLSGCVKPTYLVIFKGDDTDFPGNQEIDIIIDTEMDLTGLKAHFRFMDFTQDFNEIPENKKLSIVIPHDKTSAFPIGASDATLFFEDQSGKIRTISNRIHIVVTNSVHEAYENEDTQSVTVTVRGNVTWDMIEDKPTIPPAVTIDATLTQQGAAADAKAVGDALRSGFTEWEFSGGSSEYPPNPDSLSWSESNDSWVFEDSHYESSSAGSSSDDIHLIFTNIFCDDGQTYILVATRHLITPTKTSQLTNNGAPNGDGSPYASVNYVNNSVATNTANFLGTFDYVTDLHFNPPASSSEVSNSAIATALLTAVSSPSNNDYVFVKIDYTATTPEDEFRRFKFDSSDSVWRYEYTLNSASFTPEQWAAINSGITASKVSQIGSKADKAVPSTAGNLASLTAQGNLADSGVKPSDFATPSDLPYALVTLTTPTEWLFSGSGVQSGHAYSIVETNMGGYWNYVLMDNGTQVSSADIGEKETTVDFSVSGDPQVDITATLSGYTIIDRAGNRVVVSGDTTLTLPAANPGYLRDFLVRLEISGSTVPTITFAAPTGETIVYETDGDEFPVPDEAGDWLYSFTESCVAHKFAVALKKVNTVAQGGA